MRFNKIYLAAAAVSAALLVAACGGGGGGVATLSISGTTAVGAPVAGTALATCKSGNGTAVSDGTTGGYTVNIAGGVGPCLLTFTPANTDLTLFPIMYSVSSGSGANQTANITPMTTLLVTYLSSVPGLVAASPEDWFSSPSTVALLTNTTALTARIQDDFIPALRLLVPTLALADAGFLSVAFTPSPTASATDADLVILKIALPTPTASASLVTSLKTDASNDSPVTPPTGAGS